MKEQIEIKSVENGVKAIFSVPEEVIIQDVNMLSSRVKELNSLIIKNKNELYIRELLNRLDRLKDYIDFNLGTRSIPSTKEDLLKIYYGSYRR